MKVIDLLNKIANNEEVPKKIFYPGVYRCVLVYDEKQKDYSVLGEYYMFKDLYSYQKTQDFINDEIMVIEDEPRDIEVCGSLFTRSGYNRLAEIKEDKKIEKLDMKAMKQDFNTVENELILGYKINEIIDRLDKNGK